MPSSYEKLITAAVLTIFAGAVGIMLSVGGCAGSDIDTTSPDSYLVITSISGEPGEDGESSQGVLYSDCWEDTASTEDDPDNPGETRDCCDWGGGFWDDNLSVAVTNNGKTGMEAQFQEVLFTSYRIVYHVAGSPIGLPFFQKADGTGNTVDDVVEGTLNVSLKVGSSAAIPILAVPLERKPSWLGLCPIFLFPATITLFGTDVSGDDQLVSSSFQVHFANWMGSACKDIPGCGAP